MKFAVVELKYKSGKTVVVPINWIKKFNQKFKPTQAFLCYISLNISDEPNFDASYEKDFNGSAGTYKVFVLQVTDSIEDAIIYQREKRLKSVPKKFRESDNTEAEISAEQKRKRRSEKKIHATNKRMAMMKNISYLSETIFNVPNNEKVDDPESGETSDSSVSGEDSAIEQFSSETVEVLNIFDRAGKGNHRFEDASEILPKYQLEALTTKQSYDVSSEAGVEKRDCIADDLSCRPITEIPLNELHDENRSNIKPIAKISLSELHADDQPAIIDSIASSNVWSSLKKLNTSRKATTKQQQNAIDRDTYARIDSETDPRTNHESVKENHLNEIVGPTYQTVKGITEATIPNVPIVVHTTEVPVNPNNTIHTMDYDELMRALNQNIFVIPGDQNFIGIADSFQNEAINSKVVTEDELLRTKNCDVDDCCAFKKKYDDLMVQNANLRKQNADLSERNNALQDALVSTTKTVPPVPFESKDGGRLYNGTILLNRTQCEILDKTEDPQKYLNNLALAVFGSKILQNSSVTGSVSNNFKKPAKPALDNDRLSLIYSLMAAKTNCRCFNRSKINQILNKKIYNLNASGKPRKNQTKNNSDTEN